MSFAMIWRHKAAEHQLHWDLATDRATVSLAAAGARVWQGSLLPSFWLQTNDGLKRYIKAAIVPCAIEPADERIRLDLTLSDLGSGTLHVERLPDGLRFQRLVIHWHTDPPLAIIGFYFGASALTADQRPIVPSLEFPFWPDWLSDGLCIPSAKGAPIQSFFRAWDFGHAELPLGSFGPSLGTPYAAAFPRPLYAMAMGGAAGWVAIGSGAVPDGALSLQVRSATGMLRSLLREDLRGPGQALREWEEPLRLCWSATAWEAYRLLYETFPIVDRPQDHHQRSSINTWGSFKTGDFDLRRLADRAIDVGAKVLVIDDLWETFNGSGEPDAARFPRFHLDLDYARSRGLEIGLWQSIGWIDQPQAVGLTPDDLLCGEDGLPRKANWAMSPHFTGPLHFCLDVSAKRAVDFIRQRTQRIMKQIRPTLLKLDFGYGLPGPDVAVPRNPQFRGERMALELLRVIATAAREIDPGVTLQYYGVHPLMQPVTDIIALDDLGDAGSEETAGHSQWAIWSALAGARSTAIMASSGYDWSADDEILLNTAVIGAPGCVLPMDDAQPAMSLARLNHRRAVAGWHRRTTRWRPLWLNSEPGRLGVEPHLSSWGRIERIAGEDRITAIALRPLPAGVAPIDVPGVLGWNGRWAIISQDNLDIRDSKHLACIGFDVGGWIELKRNPSPSRLVEITRAGERSAAEAKIDGRRIRLDISPMHFDDLLGYLIETGE
jgi:hypothetical protein